MNDLKRSPVFRNFKRMRSNNPLIYISTWNLIIGNLMLISIYFFGGASAFEVLSFKFLTINLIFSLISVLFIFLVSKFFKKLLWWIKAVLTTLAISISGVFLSLIKQELQIDVINMSIIEVVSALKLSLIVNAYVWPFLLPMILLNLYLFYKCDKTSSINERINSK